MQEFCDENFLLKNAISKKIYEAIANEPILDYHCHLSATELLNEVKFKNITDLWLAHDHYKWRVMRACGVSEKYITGDGDDFNKFVKFVECMEQAVGNPLSQWCQLELRVYFNITMPLLVKNAPKIYEQVNEKLKNMTCRDFLLKSNVYAVCTTDDPIDDLLDHQQLARTWKQVKVIPNFRPDKVMKINHDDFESYMKKLGKKVGMTLESYDDLITALCQRIDYFDKMGSHSADHGLDRLVYQPASRTELNAIFIKRIKGEKLSECEYEKYLGNLMLDLARIYHDKQWVMMWHMNVNRNTNHNLYQKLGADIGCDSVGEQLIASNLNIMLDKLKSENKLGKTLLFSLNSNNWDALSSLAGNYEDNESNIRGLVQFGTAWWFNDHYTGNRDQLLRFAQVLPLGVNVGMLTDSRSYSSYTRHDYYRRVLCSVLGQWAEDGLCVNDIDVLTELAKNVAFRNAKNYFNY